MKAILLSLFMILGFSTAAAVTAYAACSCSPCQCAGGCDCGK